MFTLIKNARIYAPRDLGICDLLIADGRIAQIDTGLELPANNPVMNVIDAQGCLLVPGYVDTLVHITGGGGEGGFNSRTPELDFYDAVKSGVTTMIGALGTDASTRSLGDLYGKAKSLTADGLSCFMYTGSYEVPVKTLTGNVRDDLVFIDPVIGVGEIAIADHRGSQPSTAELARIAADAKVGGMIANKGGIVMIHVGGSDQKLDLLFQVNSQFDVSPSQFYPTHINRSRGLLEQGIEFVRAGGAIDFTASTNDHLLSQGEVRASEALAYALELGADEQRLTISSDAQGSLPHFDEKGRLDGLDIGSLTSVHEEWTRATRNHQVAIPTALAAVTRNPARICGLSHKGEISVGKDADLCLLQPDTLAIDSVMSGGRWLMRAGKIIATTAFDHKQ